MRYKQLFGSLILLFIYSSQAMPADDLSFVVISHPGNGITEIEEQRLARIYLGKIKSLPDGTSIITYDHAKKDFRHLFYWKIAKKRSAQIKAYWTRQVFTGYGFPPNQLPNDKEIINQVRSTKGAFGYVRPDSLQGEKGVIRVIVKLDSNQSSQEHDQ